MAQATRNGGVTVALAMPADKTYRFGGHRPTSRQIPPFLPNSCKNRRQARSSRRQVVVSCFFKPAKTPRAATPAWNPERGHNIAASGNF